MLKSKWMTTWMVVTLAAGMMLSGCKSTPPAAQGVLNSDGSTTNPDGSITFPPGTAPSTAAATPAPAPAPTPANPTSAPVAIRNQDGSITNPDGSVTYPAGSRIAKRENAPPPVVTANNPPPTRTPPPPPAPVLRTVAAGTAVVVRVNQTLAASKNEVGDTWAGVLNAPLTTTSGGSVFERGTPVSGTVIASKGKGRFKGAGALGIQLTSIGRANVSASEYEADNKGRGKRTGAFAGGGAGLGAIIGGIAGGGKGALIGGLTGAAAGTGAGAFTGSRDVVIPAETAVTFTLTAPLSIR